MEIVIAAFGIVGLAFLFSILIADMIAGYRHQLWVEENNRRRFAKE